MSNELLRIVSELRTSLRAWRVWSYLGMRDVRTRFRRSVVGPLWVFIHLGLLVAGVGFVYGRLLEQDLGEFLPSLTTGLVIWGFLYSSLVEGSSALIQAEAYIKQFTLPKLVYVLRMVTAQTFTAMIGLVNVAVVMMVAGTPVGPGTLFFVPGFVLLILIVTAHVWIVAYACVRIRDLAFAIGGVLSVVFYVTPIIFTAEQLAMRKLDFVYLCNPFYHLIEIVRHPLLSASPAPPIVYLVALAYLGTLSVVALAVATRLDRRVPYLL